MVDESSSPQNSTGSTSQRPQDKHESMVSGVWIKRTFKSKELTEELLKPHLEAGNITWKDYQQGVAILSNSSFDYSPLLAGAAVAGVVCAWTRYRKKAWNQTALYTCGSYFVTKDFGDIAVIKMRQRLIGGLENPNGFHRALHEIYDQMLEQSRNQSRIDQHPAPRLPQSSASTSTPSPMMKSPPTQSNEETNEYNDAAWEDSSGASPKPKFENQPLTQEPSIRSKWDEIRSADRTDKSRPSAWQNIREGEQSALDGGSNDSSRRNRNTNQTDAERERARAQAEFDELLEKERRMASQ